MEAYMIFRFPVLLKRGALFVLLAFLLTVGWTVRANAGTAGAEAHSAQQDFGAFEVHFDSTTTTQANGQTVSGHVNGRIIVTPTGDPTHYAGAGRLAYVSASGSLPFGTLDGIVRVFDVVIPANQGEITMYLFPGNPKPHEFVVTQYTTLEYYNWFSTFLNLHFDEFGQQGFKVTGWQFPAGDVYARRTYNRSQPVQGGSMSENTLIELIGRPPAPTIARITDKGIDTAGENPETGSTVRLEADIENTDGYNVTKCSWTGDLPQAKTTSPVSNSKCQLDYTPKKGPGPARETYGPKNVSLTITYEHNESGARGQDQKTHSYKVFFKKKGDDDGDGEPNWFEYWGDDGAVPGLDAPDIIFDPSVQSLGHYDRGANVIRIGQRGGDELTGRTAPASDSCPGVSHPSTQGIDTAATVVVHEGKHKELDQKREGPWSGLPDDDGDGVPNSVENSYGTDPNNPDSCNMASLVHSSYADDGDDEFIARSVHDQAVAVPENDWANPGKQTDPSYLAAGSTPLDTLTPATEAATSTWATLAGTYTDSVADTDSDGQYDTLTLSVGLNVTTAETYNVVVTLTDGAGTEVATATAQQALSAGAHTINVDFDGVALRRAGIDGPYRVKRIAVNVPTELREVRADAGDDVYDTAGYQATDFEQPDVIFTGSYSDSGVDTDGDGLYDQLRITPTLNVQAAGTYTLTGELESTALGLTASSSNAMGAGANTPALTFDGGAIYQYREDGPYDLRRLRVTDDAGQQVDYELDAYTTAGYAYTQFEHGGTTIDANSYSDRPVDGNGDGTYESLEIEFTVASDSAGPYQAIAALQSDSGTTLAATAATIGLTGDISATLQNTVTLSFDGATINDAGTDGPYTVTGVTLIAGDGTITDFHPVAHTTQAYNAADFVAERKVYLPAIMQ